MPGFGVALAWMILAPIAFLTDVVCILVISHYKPLFHSCDVAFISLAVTMASNVFLLLPIPAVMELGDFSWSKDLCTSYTWLSVVLRSSHFLVLLVVNVYWMASLRVTIRGHMFSSSKSMKFCVCASWFISIIIGLIPVTGGTKMFHYYEGNTCKFLPTNISIGFALFFMVLSLLSVVMGLISTTDTLLLFHRMRQIALTKYNAGRFHLPSVSGAGQTTSQIHAKYNELNVSKELCGLVLCYTIASTVINGLPLLASQFIQLIHDHNRDTMETTLLWLLLVEALTLPHLLWVLSKRYRHALIYTWKVFILRDENAKEEDTTACTLQSYRLCAKESNSRPYRNGIHSAQTNGNARGPDLDDTGASVLSEPSSQSLRQSGGDPRICRSQRDTIMTTDLDDGMTVVTQLKTSRVYVIQDDTEPTNSASRHGETESKSKEKPLAPTPRSNIKGNGVARKAPLVFVSEVETTESTTSSSTPTSPSKSTSSTPLKVPSEVKRSASASSRQEWKEKMRKKHLPAIFVNTSIDSDANPTPEHMDNEEGGITKESYSDNNDRDDHGNPSHAPHANKPVPKHASIESTYYVSSDYHYDYIADTLPPPLRQQATVESEGLSGMYDAEDIGHILDDSVVDENAQTDIVNRRKSVGNVSQTSIDTVSRNVSAPLQSKTISSRKEVDIASVNKEDEDNTTRLSTLEENLDSTTLANVSNKDSAQVNGFVQNVETHRRNSSDHGKTDRPPTTKSNSLDSKKRNFKLAKIGKNNYRQYLSYSNLVVSSVDDAYGDDKDAVVDDSGETTDCDVDLSIMQTQKETLITSVNSLDSSHSQYVYHNQALDSSDDIMDAKSGNTQERVTQITSSVPDKSKEELDVRTEGNNQSEELSNNLSGFIEHALLDYNQLETVSGTEMLHLKMKSVRSAMAVDFSDDTTSDEGGLDNDGFDDDTLEDEDSGGQTDGKFTGGWHERYFGRRGSNNDVEKTDKPDDLSTNSFSASETLSGEIIPIQRDGNGDGRESAVPKPLSTSSIEPSPSDFSDSKKEVSLTLPPQTNPISQDSKRANYANNPFLRESFETLSQSPEYKSRFQSKRNPFFNSTDSSFGSVFSTSIDATNDVPTPPNTDANPIQSSWPLYVDHSTSEPFAPAKVAPKKPPVPIMKPPRFRKEQEAKKSARHTSSEDELDVISHSSGQARAPTQPRIPSFSNHDVTSELTIPRNNPFSLSPKINEDFENGNNGNDSDHSIVIEPYGQRRPAWLDEPLDSSSGCIVLPDHGVAESDTDTFTNSITSSNFRYTVNEESPDDVVEYNFDSVSIGGVKNIDSRDLNRSHSSYRHSPSSQPPLVQYHFDEDTDRGFEDALAVDYMTHNNVYSGMGLCFESIKEEPEENLSETASSFGGLGDPSVFKTQAVVSSRPSSRSSITGPPSETAPSPFEEKYQVALGDGIYFNRDDVGSSFPAFERTSADGSEGIPPSHNGNGAGSPLKPTADPWGYTKTSGISANQPDHLPINYNPTVKDIERADDLNTALAVTDSSVNSAWLDFEQQNGSDPSLDMSFESDFSHQSGENHLGSEKQNLVTQGQSGSNVNLDNKADNGIVSPELSNVTAKNSLESSVRSVYF